MKNKFTRGILNFMQGRYGVDSLNKGLLAIAILTMIASTFVQSQILYWISLIALFLAYFRMFSKNIPARYRENQFLLKHTQKIRAFFNQQKKAFTLRKTHHIYTCPSCKQKIKVPKGKGMIEIRCQKCGTRFQKRS